MDSFLKMTIKRVIYTGSFESWALVSTYEDIGCIVEEVDIQFQVHYTVNTHLCSLTRVYRIVSNDECLHESDTLEDGIFYGFNEALIEEGKAHGSISGIKMIKIMQYHPCRAFVIKDR